MLEYSTTGCGLSGSTAAALMCMAWPGCLRTRRGAAPVLSDTTDAVKQKSPDTLMALSPPAIQLFSQTEVTFTMHQLPRQILTSATKCMGRFKTLTKILHIWLPPVNATRGAQQHTACVHEMDVRSVASATPSLYSHTQLLSWKSSQLYLQHETTAWSTASTPCSCLPGVLM